MRNDSGSCLLEEEDCSGTSVSSAAPGSLYLARIVSNAQEDRSTASSKSDLSAVQLNAGAKVKQLTYHHRAPMAQDPQDFAEYRQLVPIDRTGPVSSSV
jgi:hypothetical protein